MDITIPDPWNKILGCTIVACIYLLLCPFASCVWELDRKVETWVDWLTKDSNAKSNTPIGQ